MYKAFLFLSQVGIVEMEFHNVAIKLSTGDLLSPLTGAFPYAALHDPPHFRKGLRAQN